MGYTHFVVDYSFRWIGTKFYGSRAVPQHPVVEEGETCSGCGDPITWSAGEPCPSCGQIEFPSAAVARRPASTPTRRNPEGIIPNLGCRAMSSSLGSL